MSPDLLKRELPDGRTLIVNRLTTDSEGRISWECWIEGDPTTVIVGWPLDSTLADLLGYDVAHEDWPEWINTLAAEIEATSGRERDGSRSG